MNTYTPTPIDQAVQDFEDLAVEWATKDGEARRLEKMEKILFSELVNQSNEKAVSKAEHWARDHERYRNHVAEMIAARTEANVTKAKLDAKEMRFEAWRTAQATRRAEMQIR